MVLTFRKASTVPIMAALRTERTVFTAESFSRDVAREERRPRRPAGVYAPLGDVDQLADRLLLLLRDDVEAASRARALRQRVEQQFSWTTAALTIVDVYRRVSGR